MIIEELKDKAIDYDAVIKSSYIKIHNNNESDINIIIPVRERTEFLSTLLESFKDAEIPEIKVNYIVVEHSVSSLHIYTCHKNNINYVHIPCSPSDIFNKCLCHNIGVFLLNKSKYLLFHDIDCLPQKTFFLNLMSNVNNKNSKAIQTFRNRRVLACNNIITTNILDKSISVNDLSITYTGIREIISGVAPGGSIMVDYNIFFSVGGFDPELFQGYAPEDLFFWNKVSILAKFDTCDNPPNEVYHLDHLKQTVDKVKFNLMHEYCSEFDKMDIIQKQELLSTKYNNIKQYKKMNINNFFEKTYCINLDRRPERWKQCEAEFFKHNIVVERFSAVDGNPNNIISKLTDGGIGCTLSHLEIFKKAKELNLKNILIFEDDVEFTDNFVDYFNKYHTQIPEEWNLLYFGGNHNNLPLKKISDNISEVHMTYTSHAYAVNHTIYDELIVLFTELSDISDVLLSQIQQKCGKSYVFQPHLAWQRSGYSDILNVEADYNFLKTGYTITQ